MLYFFIRIKYNSACPNLVRGDTPYGPDKGRRKTKRCKTMKKRTAVLCAIVAVFTAFAVSGCNKFDASEDWAYIRDKGTMIVGYTVYDPVAYMENGELVGFEVELAKAVAAKLGIKAEFQQIDWEGKVTEINARNIDVIWNAMTITDELKEQIDITEPYMKNFTVAVVKEENAAKYADKAGLKTADKIAVEAGSSGHKAVSGDAELAGVEVLECTDQIGALNEVASGTSPVAVVDGILYSSLKNKSASVVNTGKLVTTVQFAEEYFGIGVRKGSDFMEHLVGALDELKADGTYQELAAKYNLTDKLIGADGE